MSLITEQGTTGYKVICTEAAEPENRIRYIGCTSTDLNNSINSFSPGLKSTSSGYFLNYTPGNIMLYRCSSGVYTTIMADSPAVSKNYEVDFSACVDLAGKNYSTIKIGDRTWMAENLAFLPAVGPSNTGSETINHFYVYGYEGTSVNTARAQSNYATYGALYNWPAAMASCPTGWHLPSDAEWTSLTDYLTNNGYGYEGSGSDIGRSMASSSGWNYSSVAGTIGNDQSGNNRSGFSGLPGGTRYYDGGFRSLGDAAVFWSSTD
ncbi:MAG: hypothetical protein NTV01_09000 [Bacteroidia bacterium]|nr:hypothetical protein [Bacteroidia bacterium]